MDSSQASLPTQTPEVSQVKRKTPSKRIRRKKPLRRIWSQGLPSLATSAVKMVVATLHIGAMASDDDDDDDEDDDDGAFQIGEQVQAHIPDMVLNNLNDLIDPKGCVSIPNEHTYERVTLLFLDVSGFTSLTEQYSNDAHLGIDQLTHTLNSYFDKLVSEILIHNGDIYKFAGDAILALWTNESNGAEQALRCALSLQERYGAYETNVNVVLRMKVALAYGSVRVLFIGTEEFKHYILTGDCVKDVNNCEQLCEPGDIIISKKLYEQLQSKSLPCEYAPIRDEGSDSEQFIAVKYLEAADADRDAMNGSHAELTNGHGSFEFNSCSDHPSSPLLADGFDDDLWDKIDNLMKSFLVGCVYQRIERKQSLDYLSELRRVTITFINLDISDEQHTKTNLCQNVQKVFIQIHELTKMMGGVLTKALLFDKGWSFLCVFGLPGYKQGDDTANALKCAHMIHSTISKQCQFINKCSIGVATGLTYCGVVGHVARCEYTVIGRKVNMAARLMCNYPNVISCDQETYYNSRLNSRFFQILPDKILKGMHNVGIIWQYAEQQDALPIRRASQNREEITGVASENYPLLGRKVELMIVASQILLLDEPLHRRRDLAAIVFEGDDKIGRSRLLHFIASSFETSACEPSSPGVSCYDSAHTLGDATVSGNTEIVNMRLSILSSSGIGCTSARKPALRLIRHDCQLEQRFNEFGLLRSLLRQLLHFHNEEKTQYEREQLLLRLFDINKPNDLWLRRNLFLLNDLLDVQFRRTHSESENASEANFVRTFETNINELLLHILNQLIESAAPVVDAPSHALTRLSETTTVDDIRALFLFEYLHNVCLSRLSASRLGVPSRRIDRKNRLRTVRYLSFSSTTVQPRRSSNGMSVSAAPPIMTASKILFIVDDIHFADESSLKHLLTLGSHSKCLLILSMKPPTNNNNERPVSNILQTISTDSRVYLRKLPGLELRYLATLGCQILSVHKLPAKLVKMLNESCNGIPGFCEQILFDLLRKDKIYIVNSDELPEQDATLVEGDGDKLLRSFPAKNSLFKSLFSRRKQPISDKQRQMEPLFSRICLLRDPNSNDVIAHCQQNFQNYIMCRIDRLSEGETFLIKTAAVIGNTFSRTFLWQLVDSHSKKSININSCILDMMRRTVIECAYQQQQTPKRRAIQCFCLHNPTGFPSHCRLIAFTHASIREGIYNSLTDSLKRTLTRNAIDYLEKQCTIVCSTCGPRNDIPFFVQKQDGLTRTISSSQQHAFVDIVKIAALREIDQAIKQSNRVYPIRLTTKPRSNTSTNGPPEPSSIATGRSNNNERHSAAKASGKRRNSADPRSSYLSYQRRSLSPFISIFNDDDRQVKTDPSTRRDSSNPNLLSLNVYSYPQVQTESASAPPQVESQLPAKATRSKPLFHLFKFPKQRARGQSLSDNDLLKTIDGLMVPRKTNNRETVPNEVPSNGKRKRSRRVRSFFQCIFRNIVPSQSPSSRHGHAKDQSPRRLRASDGEALLKPSSNLEDLKASRRSSSRWRTVRQVLIPTSHKVLRACPTDLELLEQPMFSSALLQAMAQDLSCLNKQTYQTQTFQNLYDRSLLFHTFQSYVRYENLIHWVHDARHSDADEPNIDQFVNEFVSYNDLRICQCADYVFTVYAKLVEYHTNLYDMHDKQIDEWHRTQFDRIMYYRTEICYLLLRSNCLQRLLVEIENGRKFLDKFQQDTIHKDNPSYVYQSTLTKYTYDLFEAIVLQRTRAIYDAKLLCEQNLQELIENNEKLTYHDTSVSSTPVPAPSAQEKRWRYQQSRTNMSGISHASEISYVDPLRGFVEKYRMEFLICQYQLLRYHLSRHQSDEAREALINSQYHIYPISFSLPCTIVLIEYFYSEMDYQQCSVLINRMITFWWPHVTAREKLELGKLKTLSLIIQLKQGALESAILSGYFAKRILTGYHENVFLIETCIHLTLALIGEMRISNIELILQHLEYLSEQTMNGYTKLWYYILAIDVAMELGYQLLPITIDFLENITKYRKKLLTGPNQQSLLIAYSDCTLAQVYARLGRLNMSKIHFQHALHQIKYDQMHLSNVDFRFKRALLKLVETQLIHWYYAKDAEDETLGRDCFLLTTIESYVHEESIPWNRTRFLIYRAYYDRLVNEFNRSRNYPLDNDFKWELSLEAAELNAVKLDRVWIKRLRAAWSDSLAEQISSQINHPSSSSSPGRSRRSMLTPKSYERFFLRPSVPNLKVSARAEPPVKSIQPYAHQTFLDWRLFVPKNSLSQFQLYVLPVRV